MPRPTLMKFAFVAAAFVLATSVWSTFSATQAGKEPIPDGERLQGTWKVVREEMFGDVRRPPHELQLTFAKDRIEKQTSSYILEGIFKLNLKSDPKELDATYPGTWMKAIYRFEGKSLILAVPNGRDGKRPKDFTSGKEDQSKFVLTFERVPVKEEKLDAEAAKEAKMKRARLLCGGNLQQLGFALWDYGHHHDFKLPQPAIMDKAGKPLLSWRVALLPHLGEKDLYEQFNLDEPWDSDHNKKLLPKMPKVYASVGKPPQIPHGTFYQVYVGEGSLFEMSKEIRYQDVGDGTVNTIAIITAPKAVPWTKPEDLPYFNDRPLPSLGGGMIEDGLFSFVTAGAGVHIGVNTVDDKLLRPAITRSGGEIIDLNTLRPK